MYEVPATSSLVLLFTQPEIYEGQAAKRLLKNVDLSAGLPVKTMFSDLWDLAYAEVTTRKLRVKRLCHEYLNEHASAQVVSLGSGLDPLTMDLAESFPAARIFDVDMGQMDVKAELNQAIDGPDIAFVTANLADAQGLTATLSGHGWNAQQPTLAIAEGITYYIPAPVFAQTLAAVRTDGGALVLEYTIPDDDITDLKNREDYVRFFHQHSQMLQLPFPMVRYSEAYVGELAQQLSGSLVKTLYSHHMELEFKGHNEFFDTPDAGAIRVSLIAY